MGIMQTNRSVSVFAAAILILAACGDRTSPRERLAAAPEATAGEATAAFTMESDMEIGGEDSGMTVNVSGAGVMDLTTRRGRMSMEIPGMGDSMAMVFDSSDVYVRVPRMIGSGEARWIHRGAGSTEMGPGAGLGGDPSYMWDVLDAVEGEIRDLGSDVVRGADVRGFAFTVSGEKLWADRENVPEAMYDLDVPVEAWLDEGNRLRRMVMEIDLGAVSEAVKERMSDTAATEEQREMGALMGAMSGTMTLTTEFYDFGTDVQIELPDSTEIMDAEQFRGRMMEP